MLSLLLLVLPFTIVAQDLIEVARVNDQFENINRIFVQGDFCKRSITQGDTVAVKGALKTNKQIEGYAIATEVIEGQLKVEVQKPKSGWTTHAGIIEVTLPDGIALEVVSSSGYITIKGVNGTSLEAKSKSGKIVAEQLQGEVSLHSRSGSIKVDAIEGPLSMSTKTGEQVARHIKGDVSMQSTKGALIIEDIKGGLTTVSTEGAQTIKEVVGDIQIKTMSGALKLSNATGHVQSQTGAGTLNLFDVTGVFNLMSTKGSVIGTRVKFLESSTINTTEGKIKLKLENKKEELSFMCQSEHAYIVAFGKSKKKKLKTGDGAIVITAVSTTGAQNYY